MDGRREISPSAFSKPSPWGPTPLVKGRWPKARGDREGEYERGALILSRPPAILWFLSHRWERNSPPAGGETPLRTTNAVRNLPPHPAPSGPPSPQGEGLSGRVWDPPLRRMTKTVSRLRRGRSQTGPPGFAPGALAEKSQAQVWNRVGCNFCTPRARWPGLNGEKALRFCAPERFCLPQGVTPVMGSGERRL